MPENRNTILSQCQIAQSIFYILITISHIHLVKGDNYDVFFLQTLVLALEPPVIAVLTTCLMGYCL